MNFHVYLDAVAHVGERLLQIPSGFVHPLSFLGGGKSDPEEKQLPATVTRQRDTPRPPFPLPRGDRRFPPPGDSDGTHGTRRGSLLPSPTPRSAGLHGGGEKNHLRPDRAPRTARCARDGHTHTRRSARGAPPSTSRLPRGLPLRRHRAGKRRPPRRRRGREAAGRGYSLFVKGGLAEGRAG